jgi:hypothetical protein
MPKDGGPPTELGASNALTVLLDMDKIYYYNGEWKDAIKTGGIIETNLSGTADLRKVIGEKQLLLDVSQKNKEGRDGLMLVIKPGNVVDVLDETTISMVKKYAIVKQSVDEKAWLKEK